MTTILAKIALCENKHSHPPASPDPFEIFASTVGTLALIKNKQHFHPSKFDLYKILSFESLERKYFSIQI